MVCWSKRYIKLLLLLLLLLFKGALAFALSNNMPEENRDLYVSTTLSIVIFTTIIIGGLTEPMLNYTKMKMTTTEEASSPRMDYSRLMTTSNVTDTNDDVTPLDENESVGIESKINGLVAHFEKEYMQPFFGTPRKQNEMETEMVSST